MAIVAPRLVLVTGPARSGKSEWAETLAHQAHHQGYQVTYIATALWDDGDQEWCDRLQAHQRRRPATWHTLEVPHNLTAAIAAATPQDCFLVDSLGTWIANSLDLDADQWQRQQQDLLTQLTTSPGYGIFVAEETGWGVVPPSPAGRLFRDRLGSCIRHLSTLAHHVYLVTGGHALDLKTLGHPLCAPPPNLA